MLARLTTRAAVTLRQLADLVIALHELVLSDVATQTHVHRSTLVVELALSEGS